MVYIAEFVFSIHMEQNLKNDDLIRQLCAQQDQSVDHQMEKRKEPVNTSTCSFIILFYYPHDSRYRFHYTKSNPIDDHSNISSKRLQKQNFKPLGHYTYMQCGTSHLQTVQENILSRIILATYRKFTVTTVRFTQNVSCNIYTHPIYQQVANVTV